MASSSIPIIDVSNISMLNVDVAKRSFRAAGSELSRALATCGFAYLVGHGIPDSIIEQCMQQSELFFKLPREEKAKFRYEKGEFWQ